MSRVLLDVPPPLWDFGGVKLFSPMDFVDSVLTHILLTVPFSTLSFLVSSALVNVLVNLYLDSTGGPFANFELAMGS